MVSARHRCLQTRRCVSGARYGLSLERSIDPPWASTAVEVASGVPHRSGAGRHLRLAGHRASSLWCERRGRQQRLMLSAFDGGVSSPLVRRTRNVGCMRPVVPDPEGLGDRLVILIGGFPRQLVSTKFRDQGRAPLRCRSDRVPNSSRASVPSCCRLLARGSRGRRMSSALGGACFHGHSDKEW